MNRRSKRRSQDLGGGSVPLGLVLMATGLLVREAAAVSSLTLRDYLSPLNAERAPRRATAFIILHTTEAPTRSALHQLYRYGEAHYLVDWKGVVYRIVDRRKVAFHAGRSMWEGQVNLDEISIGIEVVGYYDRDLNPAQYEALRILLADLKQIYRVPDHRILPHCMVAYGAPNRWHPRPHRGRKRCGLLFAMPDVRARLGLGDRPRVDPDVAQGRLVAADPYLEQALYGRRPPSMIPLAGTPSPTLPQSERVIQHGQTAWEVVGRQYRSSEVLYVFPNGQRFRGDEIRDWNRIPVGTRVSHARIAPGEETRGPVRELGRDGATARELAGVEYCAPTTFYVLPGGKVYGGHELTESQFRTLPAGTRLLVGYRSGGPVSRASPAYAICGPLWSSPETFYLFPDGSLRSGDTIREKLIPPGTRIFYPN